MKYCTHMYWVGALMFSPPTFGPSDNSTHTFSPRETGSQKLLVQVTFVPQCGPTIRPPPKRHAEKLDQLFVHMSNPSLNLDNPIL